MNDIRQPAVAGMFYSSSPAKLKDDINFYLDRAQVEKVFENVAGIISPHAGYQYSGQTAAYAFNAIKNNNIKTAVIISPSHREYFPGISIYSGKAYRTPLGDVPLDKEMISKIVSGSKFIFEGVNGHCAEHAVEVQIPFLQSVLKDISIVPIVVGDQGIVFINELAEKLATVIDEHSIIVASSDLSHFHPAAEADKLDSIIEKRIKEFDYNGLFADLENGRCEACGGGPMVALLKTSEMVNKKRTEILARSNSGDVSGDYSEVVGYLSAVVYE